MESSARNCGVSWYGRYVITKLSVLYSWILACISIRPRACAPDIPESSDQPVQGLLCWLEQQSRTDHGDEGFQHLIQLFILLLRHLCAVLHLALFAEDVARKLHKARIQCANISEAFIADQVDVVERLRSGDPGFEKQRFAMSELLCLEVQLVRARGGNGRELFLKGRHVGWCAWRLY